MNDQTMSGAAQVIIRELVKVFPRRRYTATSTLSAIMEKEGQQSVIEFLKHKYGVHDV